MSDHERTSEAKGDGMDDSDRSDCGRSGPTLLLFGKDQTPNDIVVAINTESARQKRERGQVQAD